ncbi:trichohyalin-like isoform X1 [Pantherophis guttatus]|uniref:Trichohyalin-like isoform X1 n=2 Tax=Pantherophis guttatus TaxID=94885 RepID=A0A6P9D8N0_PANGU|nr:trichohyalin-like isoform X1 [Pantherophis guttatus]XP_034291555.1 trichohyalin-like isoform X1 [Pantherophis guttatus]XP_034291556.1 trichohyalin-like isoform X1 [Pantherophis guttatus]
MNKVSDMAGLVDSICTIIAVFQKYADRKSERSSMKRRQMKRLIQKEFGDILENPRDPQIVKLTFQLLDVNGDNRVDFNEFLFLIFEMATACYSVWHLQECLSYSEESRRAVRDEEPRGNESNFREFLEKERRRDDVRERRGADRIPLQSMEEGRRGELSSELREEVDRHFEGHDRKLRDGDRRDRPSQEHQEREPEQRRLEPEEWEDIEIPEPRQRRQRESALEEDSPRQSRELVRRNDNDRREARGLLDRDEEDLYSPIVISRREDGRKRRGQETEGRHFRHGSQARVDRADYDVERSRPSRERREGEDGRRELEMHSERRSRAFEPRVADERQDRIRHRSPVEEYEELRPLSREGERRSQFQEADHRESERRSQGRSVFQSREDVRRAIRAEEEEVRRSERRRDEDEWSRPQPREASRRPEVEDLERREQERRRRPYSSELENMDRPSRSHESEGREEVRRSQRPEDVERRRREFSREETRATESMRPQSQEPEPRDPKYDRSQSYEEPRRDDLRRPRNYEVRSQERDAERRRRLQPRELVEREDNQEGQHYEHESRDRERDGRHAMSLEGETRGEDRRRPQGSASRYGERERLPEGDARMRRTGRDMASPSEAGRRELDPSSPQQISRRRAPELRRSEPRSLMPNTKG